MNKWQYYFVVIGLPFAFAVLAGWHFRKPNAKYAKWLATIGSEWKKDLWLEHSRQEHMELFNNEHFVFNWVAAIITAIVVYFAVKWWLKRKAGA